MLEWSGLLALDVNMYSCLAQPECLVASWALTFSTPS